MTEEGQVFSFTEYGHRQLRVLLDQGDYTDVVVLVSTIDARGKTKIELLKVHKLVLAAWSPVLKDMMDDAINNGHPKWIQLSEVDPTVLRALVSTFYTAQLTLSVENVWRVREGGLGDGCWMDPEWRVRCLGGRQLPDHWGEGIQGIRLSPKRAPTQHVVSVYGCAAPAAWLSWRQDKGSHFDMSGRCVLVLLMQAVSDMTTVRVNGPCDFQEELFLRYDI